MSNRKIRIAVDAMGGDHAPRAIIDGAVQACRELDAEVVLVGKEQAIRMELKRYKTSGLSLSLQKAAEVVSMEDNPLDVVRKKKDSSIRVGIELVHENKADAFVSAGNSGAVASGALFVLGRIKGIDRPAISTIMPALKSRVIVLDAGANNSCKPFHLTQFAVMGSVYSKYYLSCASPRVAVLSNGEEESKGNDMTREAHALLSKSKLNYIGYIEGKDVFKGAADVVVCDGFTGNVLLKVAEGVAECLGKALKEELSSSLWAKFGYLFSRTAFTNFKNRFDYAQYGGALLLGVRGPIIISHGRSSAEAMKNAVKMAAQCVQQKVVHHLSNDLEVGQELSTFAKKPTLFEKLFKSEKKPEPEQ